MLVRIIIILAYILLCVQLLHAETHEVDYSYDELLIAEEGQAVKEVKAAGNDINRLTLAECMQVALGHNADILDAQESIKKQQGFSLEAKAFLLPKANVNASYNRIDEDSLPSVSGITLGNDESWQSEVILTQPVFTGGEGLARRRQAKHLEKASAYELEAVVNKVVLNVKEAFYNVLLAKAVVKVRKQSVDLLEKQLELEKHKLAAGTISDFNVLRAEVELANAKTPLIKARNDLRLSLDELAKILGRPVKDQHEVRASLRIAGKLAFEDLVLNLPQALKLAQKQRPELKRYDLLEKAAEQGVDISRAGYFPNINLYGGYGWQSKFDSDSLSDYDEGWQSGVRASWKLFDSFETTGKVRQAKASKHQVRVAKNQELLNINVEVRGALSDLVEARELVYASRKVVEQAEESLRLVTSRNEAGVARQIDVLDTQVALTDARTNNIEALYAFNVAKAALEKATGEKVLN